MGKSAFLGSQAIPGHSAREQNAEIALTLASCESMLVLLLRRRSLLTEAPSPGRMSSVPAVAMPATTAKSKFHGFNALDPGGRSRITTGSRERVTVITHAPPGTDPGGIGGVAASGGPSFPAATGALMDADVGDVKPATCDSELCVLCCDNTVL